MSEQFYKTATIVLGIGVHVGCFVAALIMFKKDKNV